MFALNVEGTMQLKKAGICKKKLKILNSRDISLRIAPKANCFKSDITLAAFQMFSSYLVYFDRQNFNISYVCNWKTFRLGNFIKRFMLLS